jgi:DNA-binding CsgD family transcriptional regulator
MHRADEAALDLLGILARRIRTELGSGRDPGPGRPPRAEGTADSWAAALAPRWIELATQLSMIDRWPDAETAYIRALENWRAAGDRRGLQLTGNHRGASELFDAPDELALRRALDICNALGAVATARIIRQKMRSRGIRSVPAGQRAATRENPPGLTQRDQEVLELLEGRTNAGIATKLVISPKTVDHHVSSVLAKLGVSKRTEVAAAAKRAAATPK